MIRKLIAIMLLTCTIQVTLAQDKKPTKEETIRFINKTASLVAGETIDRKKTTLFKSCSFSEDRYEEQHEKKEDDCEGIENYVNTFNLLQVDDISAYPSKNNEKVGYVNLYFKTENVNIAGSGGMRCKDGTRISPAKSIYVAVLTIYCPIDKLGSMQKAFQRLVEIIKEENKDPFANN